MSVTEAHALCTVSCCLPFLSHWLELLISGHHPLVVHRVCPVSLVIKVPVTLLTHQKRDQVRFERGVGLCIKHRFSRFIILKISKQIWGQFPDLQRPVDVAVLGSRPGSKRLEGLITAPVLTCCPFSQPQSCCIHCSGVRSWITPLPS